MPFGFPPVPVYPNGYDSDYTLFKVYNTAEAQTTEDTDALSDEVSVRPRRANQPEVWADNGYANIAGELFYYDAVQKNANGKVCRLRRCSRALGGRPSQFNPTGTWVRGFVIAEHHNQIVNGVLLAENFIGENFSPDPATLDWRIRHLADSPFLADDICPDVDFLFETVNSNPLTGTTTRYAITIRGSASFKLDFGDGSFTTSQKSGTHVYSPGATISPVLVLEDRDCQLVISPTDIPVPPTTTTPPYTINIPIPPEIPPTVIPSIIVPGPTITIPPIVLPSITGMPIPPISIPSQINVTPIPSNITISPPINVPSRILGPDIKVPSKITFDNVPSMIMFGPPPPIPPIQIQPPNIPPIQVEPIKSDIPSIIRLESPSLNGIERALSNFKFPSVIDVRILNLPMNISQITIGDNNGGLSSISILCCDEQGGPGGPGPGGPGPGGPGGMSNTGGMGMGGMGGGGPGGPGGMSNISLINQANLRFGPLPKLELDVESLKSAFTHVRSEFQKAMTIEVPKPTPIKVDWGIAPTLKAVLKLEVPKRRTGMMNQGLLADDTVEAEDVPFNGEFKLLPPDIPPVQVQHDIPNVISVESNLQDIRLVGAENIPSEIQLLPPKDGIQVSVVPFTMPDIKFNVEALEGLSIPLKIPDLPSLKVEFPEKMPGISVVFPKKMPKIEVEVPKSAKVPLVYEGPPIPVEPVKINFIVQPAGSDVDESYPCVVISPCPRR